RRGAARHRLWISQIPRHRDPTDAPGPGPWDTVLHGARAGFDSAPRGQSSDRCLGIGCIALRTVDGPAAVRGRDRAGSGPPDRDGRTDRMHPLFACVLLLPQDKPAAPRELSKGGTELKRAFAEAEGKVRLLLIVSPG